MGRTMCFKTTALDANTFMPKIIEYRVHAGCCMATAAVEKGLVTGERVSFLFSPLRTIMDPSIRPSHSCRGVNALLRLFASPALSPPFGVTGRQGSLEIPPEFRDWNIQLTSNNAHSKKGGIYPNMLPPSLPLPLPLPLPPGVGSTFVLRLVPLVHWIASI